MAVVELGEAFKIDDRDANVAEILTRNMNELVSTVLEQAGVGQTGQTVVEGKVIELTGFFEVVYCKRQIARQFGQQFDFFLMEKLDILILDVLVDEVFNSELVKTMLSNMKSRSK